MCELYWCKFRIFFSENKIFFNFVAMNSPLFISPCPNDSFIFYAMMRGLVGSVGEVGLLDIEALNCRILSGGGVGVGVVKGSVAVAVDAIAGGYGVLEVGGAMGWGNGPVVVSGGGRGSVCGGVRRRVALPGRNTTAAMLFERYWSGYEPVYMPFFEIAGAVQRGEVDMGVLIHEGRFTYGEMGLELVADLGGMWEEETGLPLPLGLIYTSMGIDTAQVEEDILGSLEYAVRNREEVVEFAREHAQELSTEVLNAHIDYFVNDFTRGLGDVGREAVNTLLGQDVFAR